MSRRHSKGSALQQGPADHTTATKWLSHPVVIAIVGVLVSTVVGGCYWIVQQKYQTHYAAATKIIKEAEGTEGEVVSLVSQLISAGRLFVGAFQDKAQYLQLEERRKEANKVQVEWDKKIGLIELNMKRYFPSERVTDAWEELSKSLGTLDDEALEIRAERNTSARQHEIAQFDRDADEAETRLKTLSGLMNDVINKLRRQLP